jgi:SAM-dependent methyltransferase
MTDDDLTTKRAAYRPAEYWTNRLGRDFSLRGVGHVGYTERYNEWMYRQKRYALRRILQSRRGGVRALVVGSGIGWVVNELLAVGYDVAGCDISPLAVERLSARFPGRSFAVHALGAGALPHADASFDVVTILDVTYHVVDDELWSRGLAELARVLRPGGHLVVIDRFGGEAEDKAAHVRFRSRAQWEAAGAAVGLSLEDVIPVYRWLSRDHDRGLLRRLPGAVRGAVELGLERVVPREPHMRAARFVRS